MAQTVIEVPTLNDSIWDFGHMITIWEQVSGYEETVEFKFSHCHFLRPNAVAFLGGLARLVESRFGSATFDWASLGDEKVMTNLRQNGFAGIFGHFSSAWSGHSIPYREDATEEPHEYWDYLARDWLGRGCVHISPRLSDAIVGKMLEIYVNAFEHAGSPIGVFSCGQRFPKRDELVLSVVDFGIGIAANVRNFLRSDERAEQLTASACLRWAFESGTSTRPNNMARGLGLDLLREFIRVNHGKLEVFSNEGYVFIDAHSEQFVNRQTHFGGTIFHITLQCDERYYHFEDEEDEDLPF